MTCARYRALISRYLDDELTPRQRADLLAHVEHCPSCAAELARYRQGDVALRKLAEGQPKPELKSAVLREIRQDRRRRRRRLNWILSAGGRASPRLVVTLAAIVLLLPVAVGLVMSSAARQAVGSSFGFSGPSPSPTVPYLVVPASATPVPPGPFSPPHLIATSPYDGASGVDSGASLLVSFDQPMDRRSVERAFRVSPPVPGDFQWEADNQLRFQPKAPGLLRGVHYTVALTDGARSLAGAVLPPATLWSFHTLAAPTLLAVYPASQAVAVPATATLVLTFSQPMDTASVSPLLRLGPAVESSGGADSGDSGGAQANPAPTWTLGGTATWSPDGRILRFQPEAPLPATSVMVTLAPGGRDQLGGAFPPTVWTFTVAAPRHDVTFAGPRLRTLAASGAAPSISYTEAGDPGDKTGDTARFALYPLTEADLASRLAWLLDATAPLAAPWPLIPTGDQAPIRSWTGQRPAAGTPPGETSALTTTIPVRDPGLYLLTAEMAGARRDQRVVALSDEGVLLWMAEGRWWAWVSRLDDGRAVAGAHIRLYDAAGNLLTAGTTDARGLFSVEPPARGLPALVLSEHDGNIALAQADPDLAATAADRGNGSLNATVILDRARYHAGNPLLFSAVVHPPNVDLAGSTVAVALRDPQRRVIGTLTLQPDSHGAINGAFTLAPNLSAGQYSLVFQLKDRLYYQPFAVDPAAPAPGRGTLQLSLDPAMPTVYAGEPFTATVRADYGAGRPAAGITVTLKLLPTAASAAPLASALTLTATTDDDGLARVPVRVPAWDPAEAPGSQRGYQLVAGATDNLGQAATALALIDAWAGHIQVEQTLQQHTFAPGATALITVTLRDDAGHPLSGQPVSSELYTAVPSRTPATGDQVSLLTSLSRLTDAAGVATTTLTLPLQGTFVVRSVVTTATGLQVAAGTPIWVYAPGSAVPWAMGVLPPAGVALTPDQESYHPGETAHLLLQSSDAGGGLLISSLDDRIVGVQPINFADGSTLVAVAIPTDVGTASSLDVRFARFAAGGDGSQLWEQRLTLPILAAENAQLDLVLPDPTGPDGYLPGRSLPVHLLLPGDGAPAGGEVLIQLAEVTPLPAGPDSAAWPVAASWMGATGGSAPATNTGATVPPAYWGPDLALDSTGQLSTTVPLPDQPGLWNLDAWAFTPGGVRHVRRVVRVQPALAIQWTPLTTLVQGDLTTVTAALTNNGATPANLDLRLQLSGSAGLDLAGSPPGALRLAPGETRDVVWTLRAGTPGDGQITLDIAQDGTPAVHRTQALVVVPYGVAATQTHAGIVGDSETINMTLPPEMDLTGAELEVRAAPTLVEVLADTLSAQALPAGAADRGSVSDAAARLMQASAVQALYTHLGLDLDDLPAGLAGADQLDLQYLYSAQRADGSWGAWPGAPADRAVTLQVMETLWEVAQDSTAAVDPGTVNRGLAWVRRAATGPVAPGAGADSALSADQAPQIAEALYLLSLYKQADASQVNRLLAAEPQLQPHERALLALTLAHTERADEARLVVTRLADEAGADAADPLVLEALLNGDPTSSHGPLAAQATALLSSRIGATWGAADVTAATVLALSHYALAIPDTPATGSYRVLVNGQVIREVVLGPGKDATGRVVLTIPGTRLHTGDNPVRLETNGLHLYYSLRAQAFLATGEHPIASRSADNGSLGLLRVYEPGPAGSTTVVLTLTVTSPLGAARLDDALPAGLVPLGVPTLVWVATSGGTSAASDLHSALQAVTGGPQGPSLWLGPLAPGTYVVTYPAVPVAPGTYTALPALFQALGDPVTWARSGSSTFSLEH